MAIGFVLLVAHALAAAVFPGGPVLCDEGGGIVKIKPLHAPHAPSCCAESGDESPPSLDREEHGHDDCTDTAAIAPFTPADTGKMKAPLAGATVPLLAGAAAPITGRAPEPPAMPPPTSPLISTTVIRS